MQKAIIMSNSSESKAGINLKTKTESKSKVEMKLHLFTKTFTEIMEGKIVFDLMNFRRASMDSYGFTCAGSYSENFPSDEEALKRIQIIQKHFPAEKKFEHREIFIETALEIFESFESQFMVVLQEDSIESHVVVTDFAEDVVNRIIDYIVELGTNREGGMDLEISTALLITAALQPNADGLTFNSEWSAVKILENTGIVILSPQSECSRYFVKKYVKAEDARKYGFRIKFESESEYEIFGDCWKVKRPTAEEEYKYQLTPEMINSCKQIVLKEILHQNSESVPIHRLNRLQAFRLKMEKQKLEEQWNSDQVFKQITDLSQKLENLQVKLAEVEKPINSSKGSLKPNMIWFEVRDPKSAHTATTTTTPLGLGRKSNNPSKPDF